MSIQNIISCVFAQTFFGFCLPARVLDGTHRTAPHAGYTDKHDAIPRDAELTVETITAFVLAAVATSTICRRSTDRERARTSPPLTTSKSAPVMYSTRFFTLRSRMQRKQREGHFY